MNIITEICGEGESINGNRVIGNDLHATREIKGTRGVDSMTWESGEYEGGRCVGRWKGNQWSGCVGFQEII